LFGRRFAIVGFFSFPTEPACSRQVTQSFSPQGYTEAFIFLIKN
jgi:hypothetical protein